MKIIKISKYLFIQVILPLFVGITIYLFFREANNYQLFNWLKIEHVYFNHYNLANLTPNWFKYNLPNALWSYSFLSAMIFIWNKNEAKETLPWILIACFVGITFEFFQLFKIIPGTFDISDILFIVFGMILSIFNNYFKRKRKYYEKFKTYFII